MKGIRQILLLVLTFIGICESYGQETIESVTKTTTVTKPDTIIRSDTIVIREVITRTDVVHRTETVIRYEESKGVENTKFENSESSTTAVINNPLVTENSVTSGNSTVSENQANVIIPTSGSESGQSLEPKGDGNFIWVPREMEGKVNQILNGGEVVTWADAKNKDSEDFDPNEKVTFRGDTIPMVLKSRNLGRFDRGLFNFLYIPKGIWQIGLTASYGEFSTEDLEVLDLISDIDFSGHIFSIRPYFSYFLRNNISVGMRLGYTSGKASIGSFNVDIDEDMSFNLHDIMYRSETYTAALTFSQYLGIARRGRFGVYNEVELAFSSGSSDFHRPFNGEMKETHTTTMQAALNFSPGLCVYILDQLSFNISFGVFGLNLKHENQKENGIQIGERTTSGANFRFNIFNINFGIAVNI